MSNKQKMARLLSGRDEPSVLEKEALFDDLMRRLPPHPRRSFHPFLAFGGALSLAGAAAGISLYLHTVSIRQNESQSSVREFSSRGALQADGGLEPVVRLACVDDRGEEQACAIGRTLVFEFASIPTEFKFFSAFAQTPDGTTLWYFPDSSGQSPLLERANALQNRAIQLENPHAQGEYRVYTVFSKSPVTRADLKRSLGSDLASNEQLLVVMRRITVQGQQ